MAEREDARLAVSRHAARLFLERGVAATSGDDIAEAAGLSKRTVWRYFRSKQASVEPLFSVSSLRFASVLREWPRDVSIETHLHAAIRPLDQTRRNSPTTCSPFVLSRCFRPSPLCAPPG